MISMPGYWDKAAIGLSIACTIHCLALPVLVAVLPALTVTLFGDEAFHQWMLIAVLPTSLFALTMGCKQHGRWLAAAIGMCGLALMVMAAFYGHDLFGETGEKIVTVCGASIIALSHIKNQTYCKKDNCHC